MKTYRLSEFQASQDYIQRPCQRKMSFRLLSFQSLCLLFVNHSPKCKHTHARVHIHIQTYTCTCAHTDTHMHTYIISCFCVAHSTTKGRKDTFCIIVSEDRLSLPAHGSVSGKRQHVAEPPHITGTRKAERRGRNQELAMTFKRLTSNDLLPTRALPKGSTASQNNACRCGVGPWEAFQIQTLTHTFIISRIFCFVCL